MNTRRLYLIFSAIILLNLKIFAIASSPMLPPISTTSESTIIHADEEIRCEDQKYHCVACQNARAQKGSFIVYADQIWAFFSHPPSHKEAKLLNLKAKGNVRFTTPQGEGHSEQANYDLTTEILILTGKNINVATAQEKLTAKERIIYDRKNCQVAARGQSTFSQKDNLVKAEILTAYFKTKTLPQKKLNPPVDSEKWELQKVIAENEVMLSTPKQIAHAQWGLYNPINENVFLKGNVKVLQDENLGKGETAVVNLKTKQATMNAKLEGSFSKPQRVQAILKPKPLKK